MSACPCCLEDLKRPFLGLGGRQLAGACEVCGDAVCERCLHTALLEAHVLGARAASGAAPQRRVRAHACAGCLYTLHLQHGETPPFAQPAGLRRRAAQAACPHVRRAAQLRFCPDCGAQPERGEDPVCDGCGAPSHERFNCCFSCGESFGEENAPEEGAAGYVLDFECDARACTGQVAAHMAHCPWCGVAQRWEREEEDADCGACSAVLEATWAFCAACGTEAPLPEQCASCTQDLEAASCAARCEACRQLVCDECFVPSTLPSAAERGELLLCAGCVEQLGAVPVAEDEDEEEPVTEEDEDTSEGGADWQAEAARQAQQQAAAAAQAAAQEEAARRQQAEAEEEEAEPEEPEPAPLDEPSPWEVLGVAPGTPLPEVKRAYLQLVAQYHPDKVAQLGPKLQRLALEETRKLNLAWSELRERAR